MPEARARRLIRAAPAVVFDFISDIDNAPRWMFGVREVRGTTHRPVLEGDRLHIRLVAGGRLADSEWVIGRCVPPRLLTSSGQALGATGRLEVTCLAQGSQLTEVTQRLVYQLPGGPLGLLAARFGVSSILELQAQRSLQSLAGILEKDASGSARPVGDPAL
jgi:uncharacterized protein YndB with AHSA1/START domain